MNVVVTRAWNDIASKLKGALAGGAAGGISSIAGLDQILLWVWNGIFHLQGTTAEMSPSIAAVLVTLGGVLIGGWLTRETVPLSAIAPATPLPVTVVSTPLVSTIGVSVPDGTVVPPIPPINPDQKGIG